MCLRLRRVIEAAMGLVFLLSAGYAWAEGDNERQALREAAQGNLEGVLIVYYFGGFVAIPKSFVLMDLGSEHAHPHFDVSQNPKSSIRSGGYIEFGAFFRRGDGAIVEMDSGVVLAARPMRELQHGNFTVILAGNGSSAPIHRVLITEGAQYIELVGGAVTIANEFVEAYESLSGPPRAFSSNWTPHVNQLSLIPGIESTTSAIDAVRTCILHSLRLKPIFSAGSTFSLKVDESADVKRLSYLKLVPGDLVISAGGHRLDGSFDITAEIESVGSSGHNLEFGVVRGGADTKVTVDAAGAAAFLSSCPSDAS